MLRAVHEVTTCSPAVRRSEYQKRSTPRWRVREGNLEDRGAGGSLKGRPTEPGTPHATTYDDPRPVLITLWVIDGRPTGSTGCLSSVGQDSFQLPNRGGANGQS